MSRRHLERTFYEIGKGFMKLRNAAKLLANKTTANIDRALIVQHDDILNVVYSRFTEVALENFNADPKLYHAVDLWTPLLCSFTLRMAMLISSRSIPPPEKAIRAAKDTANVASKPLAILK